MRAANEGRGDDQCVNRSRFRSWEELKRTTSFLARMLLCVLLPSHALIGTLGIRQGDAKLPKHVTAINERVLERVPAEACVRSIMAERHPKATREADGKFRSQSKAC